MNNEGNDFSNINPQLNILNNISPPTDSNQVNNELPQQNNVVPTINDSNPFNDMMSQVGNNQLSNNNSNVSSMVTDPNTSSNQPNSSVTTNQIFNPVADELSNSTVINPEDRIEIDNNSNNIFLNQDQTSNTMINDLNVDGTYNNIAPKDYSQEPQVQENIKKRNTITVTGEGKVFIIIILALLIFIIIMPYIFDLIREIKY